MGKGNNKLENNEKGNIVADVGFDLSKSSRNSSTLFFQNDGGHSSDDCPLNFHFSRGGLHFHVSQSPLLLHSFVQPTTRGRADMLPLMCLNLDTKSNNYIEKEPVSLYNEQ